MTGACFPLWLARIAAVRRAARGGSTMDDMPAARDRESAHLMLITPERVFYAGLLGRPRERCPGAFHVYVAIKGSLWLSTAGGREAQGELLVTMPNLQHTIAGEHRSAICVAIEPETVRAGAIDALAQRLSGPERPVFADRIRAAYAQLLRDGAGHDITRAELDIMFFGEALPARALDPRISQAIAVIDRFSGEPVTAASCAQQAGLSQSRFLHLFKEETGISR